MAEHDQSTPESSRRAQREELKAFLFLTVVLAPVIAVFVVGGYGLMVWLYQMFTGPPTH